MDTVFCIIVNQKSALIAPTPPGFCIVSDDRDGFLRRLKAAVRLGGGNAAVAKAADMPLSTLNTWLSGKAEPKLGPLVRIARVCGTTVDALAGFEDDGRARRSEALRDALDRAGGAGMVARALHVSEIMWRRYLAGELEPPRDLLERLERLAGLEAGALSAGARTVGREPDADVVCLPVLDVRAAAGPGAINEGAVVARRVPFSRVVLSRLGASPERVHGIVAAGDSMEPTIADGAMVLIDTARTALDQDGIYALVVDDQARLKRVARQTDGSVLLISDADRYPPERLDRDTASRLQVVGRAIWTERAL